MSLLSAVISAARLPSLVICLCCVAAFGCRSKPDDGGPPEAAPAVQADPTLAAWVDDVGDRALLTVIARPDEVEALITAIVARLDGALPGVRVPAGEPVKAAMARLRALPGIDLQRRVVLALVESPIAAPPGALALQLPDPADPKQKPLPLRYRALLPASDPAALAAAIGPLLGELGELRAGRVFAEDGRVRIEVADGAPLEDWSVPGGKSARTPAHAAFVAADGPPLRILIRPWHLRAAATLHGARQIAMALAYAAGEMAPQLAAAGMAELLGAEPMMTAEGAEFDDWMIGVGGGPQALSIDAVATLTEAGRSIMQRRGRYRPLKVGDGAVAEWALSGDVRAMLDSATVPAAYAGQPGDVSRRFMGCGPGCALHVMARRPFAAGKAGLALVSRELPLLAGEMRAPQVAFFGLQGEAPAFAAAWQVPATADLGPIRAAVADAGAIGLQLWTRPLEGDAQAVIVGMGVTPDAAFGAPLEASPLARLAVDPSQWDTAPPDVRQALSAFGGLAGRLDVAGGALVGQLRLGFTAAPTMPEAPTTRAVYAEGPIRAAAATPGSACLQRATLETRRALEALSMAPPDTRSVLAGRALVEVRSDLACAEAEAPLKPAVQGLVRLLLLPSSSAELDGWRPAPAIARLKPLCESGDAVVCARLKAVEARPAVALPEVAASAPAIDGCPAPLGVGAALRMKGDDRWLGAEALPGGDPGRDRLRAARDLQLGIDGETPWRAVRPLVAALADAQVDGLTLAVERDGAALGVPVRLRREKTAKAADRDRVLMRNALPRGVAVRIDGAGATLGGEPITREALRARMVEAPEAILDLYPGDDVPWQTVVEYATAACGGAVLTHLAPAPDALMQGRLGQGQALDGSLLGRVPPGGWGLSGQGVRSGGGEGIGIGIGNTSRRKTYPQPTVEGGSLGKDIIRRVIRRHRPQVRDCYERALRLAPELKGKLTARFTIGADGAVAAAEVEGDLDDAAVRACVAEVVQRMRFPKAESVTQVSYPFVFSTD